MEQWRKQIAKSSQNLNWIIDPQLNVLLGIKKGAKIGRAFGNEEECFIKVQKDHSCLIIGYEVNTPKYNDRFECKLWGNDTLLNSSYVNIGYRKQFGLLIPQNVMIRLTVVDDYNDHDNDELLSSCSIDYLLLDHNDVEMGEAQHTDVPDTNDYLSYFHIKHLLENKELSDG